MGTPEIVLAVVVALGLLAATVVATRRRRPEPRNEPEPDSGREEALARTALPEALAALGFSRADPRHPRFVRDHLLASVALTNPRADDPVDHVDLRITGGSRLRFAEDLVATARRTAPTAHENVVRIQSAEGSEEPRPAPARDREAFGALIARHAGELEAVGWTRVELFHHRSPRLHLCVRPVERAGREDQLRRAIALLEAMWSEFRG